MQLYTITTLILTGQTIYYSHIYHHLKLKNSRAASKVVTLGHADNHFGLLASFFFMKFVLGIGKCM
jgi:hypothetical protein